MRKGPAAAKLAPTMNDRAQFPRHDDAVAVAPTLARRVLLCDVEPATAALFAEWLAAEGLRADSDASAAEPPAALILIELPFPRQGGQQRLRELARAWPGVPVIVLSPTLLPGVAAQGGVARQLGATAVLAAPVARDTLRAAVAQALQRRRMT